MRKKMWPLRFALVAGIFFVLLLSVTSSAPGGLRAAKRVKLANEFNQVQTAVLNYYTEYSVYPVAADNATLMKMLDGSSAQGNARQIQFLTIKAADQDASGAMLDPWGTPIRFSVDADGNFYASSAGPDKTFGTADDIVGHFDSQASK